MSPGVRRNLRRIGVNQESLLFGEELRRRRLTAGLTLAQLAQQIHYSKSQISKVERGIKPPSRDLARLCDSVLRANGALASILHEKPGRTGVPAVEGCDGEAWLMQLSASGQSWVQQVSRRQMLTAGALAIPGIYIGKPASLVFANSDVKEIVDISRSLFDQYRQLGHRPQRHEVGYAEEPQHLAFRQADRLPRRCRPRHRAGRDRAATEAGLAMAAGAGTRPALPPLPRP